MVIRPRHIMMTLKRKQQRKVDNEIEVQTRKLGNTLFTFIVGGFLALGGVSYWYWNSQFTESDNDVKRKEMLEKMKAVEEGKALMSIKEKELENRSLVEKNNR